MKRSVALTLLVILGNAITVAIGAAALIFMGHFREVLPGLALLAAYVAGSVLLARSFKRRFGCGYRKYFLLGALPALAVSFILFSFCFGADSFLWVLSGGATLFSAAYCLFFGAVMLVIWGREEYDRNN